MDGPNVQHPLSVGEIFDRALTVYVRNWPAFSALAAANFLLNIFLDYRQALGDLSSAMTSSSSSTLDQMRAVLLGWGHQQPRVQDTVPLAVILVLPTLALVLTYPAFLIGFQAVTYGRPLGIATWIAQVVPHFGRLISLSALWMGIFAVGAVSLVALLVTISNYSGISLFFLISFVGWLLAGFSFATSWSLFITVDEDKGATAALKEGIARALGSGRFWRSTGVSLGFIALNYVISGLALFVLLWTKSAILYAVLRGLLLIASYSYGALVSVVYFLDARLRDAAATQTG